MSSRMSPPVAEYPHLCTLKPFPGERSSKLLCRTGWLLEASMDWTIHLKLHGSLCGCRWRALPDMVATSGNHLPNKQVWARQPFSWFSKSTHTCTLYDVIINFVSSKCSIFFSASMLFFSLQTWQVSLLIGPIAITPTVPTSKRLKRNSGPAHWKPRFASFSKNVFNCPGLKSAEAAKSWLYRIW